MSLLFRDSTLSLDIGQPPAVPETRGNPLENPAVPLSSPPAWFVDAFTGGPTASGVAVTEQTAMQLATVFNCVNVIASDISSLPLKVYKDSEKGKVPAEESDLFYLLGVEPNPEMTPAVFLTAWVGGAVLSGNGYAEIQREGNKPIALWPWSSRVVRPKRVGNDLVYEITSPAGTRQVAAANMLHLHGLTLDGMVGLSPIQAARQTIGTAIAAEKFGAGFFGRGSRPSGLLAPSEQIKSGDARLDQARLSWEAANSGDNQGRTAVMPYGWTWTKIGISPAEAQFLETQQYTRAQIAGLFRVPPHMVGDTSRLSNSNHESQGLEYVTFTLRPWLVRIEAEMQRKLMPKLGRGAGTFTVRFDVSELIRGDFASQMAGFSIGRQWGFYNANDIRQKLGENPIGPDGDLYLVPLNMVAAGSVAADGSDKAAGQTESAEPAGDGVNDASSEAIPKGNGGRNQRQLMDRMATVYGPLMADACSRLARRSRRDAEAVQQIFGPVTEVIAAEARRQAAVTFGVDEAADLGTEKILRDYRKTLEKRAVEWQLDKVSTEMCSAEATRAIRAIVLPIFREAGGQVALAA